MTEYGLMGRVPPPTLQVVEIVEPALHLECGEELRSIPESDMWQCLTCLKTGYLIRSDG